MPAYVGLDEFVGRVNQLAPLPAMALRVMRMAEDEKSSAQDLASAIATDQALTARLLRLANSAYFAAGREIATVRDAVVLLGVVEIRRLVLTTTLMGRFGAELSAPNLTAFWGNALAVAMVAEVMARHTGAAAPEEAFTAGMLHDLGRLVMHQYAREQLERATTLATARGMRLEKAEAEEFGFTHAQVGHRLACAWRLPPALAQAIADHHDSPGADQGLSYVVAQAHGLCRDHGLWCGFEDIAPAAADGRAEDPLRAAALARLGGFDAIVERATSFLSAAPIAADTRRATSAPASPSRPEIGQRGAQVAADSSPRRSAWAVQDRFPGRLGRR